MLQLIVLCEGVSNSMWEIIETAEMLSAGVLDPAMYSQTSKEKTLYAAKVCPSCRVNALPFSATAIATALLLPSFLTPRPAPSPTSS